MRIVKLSDLSEEDKKRIQERQIQNLRTNRQNRIEANKKFNELINQKGEFDTSRHTSTVGRLQKAYKNNETVKKSLDGYYKNNTTSLWKGTQNFADATGKIGENTYKGAENGILSSIQNLGRNMFNLQGRKEEENIFDKVNKQILDSRKDLSPEERTSIIDKMNNSSFSQKNLIKGIEEKNQKFQEKKNENTLKIQQNADSISNPVGKYIAGEIAPGIGQMLPGMLPGIGTTYFISSATGNYHDDAIQRGMTEDQATIYSGTMGIIEGALESLGANLTKNVGKQLLKKNIKGALVNYGLDIGENFLEESIVEPISEIAAQVYGGKDKADWSNVGQRMIESGVAGALTSAITGGASAMIGGIGSKVTQQNQYVDYNTNKKLNKDSQNWLKQAENIIQENSTPKLSPQLAQNQQNTTTQQITPTIQNNVQNGISEQTNSMLNNKEVPMLNYQYEKSDNVKINNLRQDANKYFNNSEKARNYVSMLEKIITDKNIDIRLDANLKTPDGKIANGSYSNGVITINPNSTRAGEFIAVHELTHAIGTDSMRNIIETYRKSNPEFNTAVEKLLQNYNSSEITEEALSDVSAQLFGNQEFINKVAQTNPNIFKKIYSEIKYLWHQFRGYKNQDQFIEDLYYKWTQAYNSSNKLNETSNYSIVGKQGMKNAIKQDSKYRVIKDAYKEAQRLVKSNIDNEKIRQNTGWFKDRNGDWKFEISDKDLQLKQENLQENVEYELGNLIEHRTLFDMYPKLKRYTVIFNDSMQNDVKGVYHSKSKNIEINSQKVNTEKNIKSTLLHEIQHIIQNTEKFERGASKKYGEARYYNSLGEIEAKDTQIRYEQEQKGLLNRKKIAPESSKTNPIHPENTKYSIFNDSNIDKTKKNTYDWNNRGEEEYEIENITNVGASNEKNIFQNNRKDRGIYRDRIDNNFQESENNSGSFSFDKNAKRYEDLQEADTVKFYKRTDGTINIEISNNNQLINQFTVTSKDNASKQLGNNIAYYIYDNATESSKTINLKQVEKTKIQDTSFKGKQLEIIQKTNPMLDDYHTGIRSVEDIKTFDEVLNDEESFAWGDFTKEDAERALKSGKITIYSSYPIKQGTFVSTSKIQAEEYAGGKGNKVYSKTIPLEDVAWINGDEGQYASINTKYSQNNGTWQSYLNNNFKSTGTRTSLQDIKNIAPIAKDVKNNNAIKKAPVNTSNMQENVSEDFKTNKNDVDNIATILEKPVEKVKEKDRSWAIIKANLIDKGKVFEELSIKTGNRELQGKWDYTLTSTARGQNAIGHARYELNPNTKTQKQISKSLTDIIDEVGENTADFYSYMYHQLNIDRMTLEERFSGDTGINYERKNTVKNKPVFGESVTADISRQRVTELENKYPEFKSYAQDVYDYLDANTKELVDNGVISKETQQLFKDMYPHYVPISRARNKGIAINVPLDTGRTGINNPIKKAIGGSSDINPLFETIADRTLQTYRASARNSFGIELKNTINQTNQLKQFAERTDIDTLMENMTDEEQNKQLLQKGENGENPTFTVFEKGEKVTYEINRDMYDALKPKNELLSKIDENKISKIANKINNFRRGLLTEYNPVFSLTNAIKDSQDILLNSQHSGKTYVKIPEATAQILSKGYWYNEYIQNGGLQNSYFKDGEFDTTKNNLPTKIKKTITFPLRAISSVNNVIEMTPRLAEYIVSREQGRSIETSMLDAARVTTNFKAGGDITKTLNRNGFTFLNASVQGMQQQIRNIQEANAKGLKGYAILVCKYAIAGAPVLLLNNLIWADDDEYEELQDYVKDNYYIIGKLSGGNFLRIPKGRAVATIQKIVSNANEFIKNDSINSDEVGKVFWKDVKNDIKFGIDNLAPNNPIENNILSPIFQVIANKTWYGDDLVPSRLQNKPKEEQYDETTDSFSRWLGEKAKISPIKINYLIDQYFGGASDVILPMLTPQAENNVLEDKFIANATMKNKYPGEFFAKVDELETNQNSSKATDEDILKYKYISSVSKDIGELYAKKREIQNSSATDKEKKARLIDVQKRINALAKDSLENVDFIQKSGDTAIIGEEKYYKYKGEWKQLSEEEAKKIKGISLNTYANYQNKVATLSDAKKKKDESVSQKDRVKILDNANYTANEKDKIYTQIINTDDNTYQILKKLDSNKNIINQYLDYLQADLEADREDDGTEKGKAISGTKKKKVSNYINSIDSKDMSYVQRLYLAGINTTLSTSEKKKLFTYINENKSLTSKEKMEALDKLQGFTVYKNGKVTW